MSPHRTMDSAGVRRLHTRKRWRGPIPSHPRSPKRRIPAPPTRPAERHVDRPSNAARPRVSIDAALKPAYLSAQRRAHGSFADPPDAPEPWLFA